MRSDKRREQTEAEPLRFPSKVDWWLYVLIAVGALAGPVGLYFTPREAPIPDSKLWTVGIATIVPVLFIGWMFATTDYLIAGGNLRVRCGPMKLNIPLDSITRVAASTSMASGAALSLSRIAVEYGAGKEVIISPADRQGFIQAIVARVPNVGIEGLDEYR